MEVEIKELEGYTEIILNGRLDTNTAPELGNALTKVLDKGTENILVDFAELSYISSSGLRVFLVAAKTLDTKGKKLNFCAMKDFIKEIFELAGFDVIFKFYNTRDEFLAQ